MTARLPFTQASVCRRIAAARKAGLRVTGIATDGTVLVVHDGDNSHPSVPNSVASLHAAAPATSKWEDAEA